MAMLCVYVLSIVHACVCLCMCEYRCVICVFLRTSFRMVHGYCASYCVCVQTIKVGIGMVSLCLSLYLSLPLPIFYLFLCFLISLLYMIFLPATDNFCELLLYVSAIWFYQGSHSFSLLQTEASTPHKTTIPTQKMPVTILTEYHL